MIAVIILFFPCNPGLAGPSLIAVGRFVEKKGPYLTLLAFKLALAKVPSARLRMLGDGPLMETCERIATAIGIDEHVDFEGAHPHETVRMIMGGARGIRPAFHHDREERSRGHTCGCVGSDGEQTT